MDRFNIADKVKKKHCR